MDKHKPIAPEIEQILREHLQPSHLQVINDSANHHGHAGDNHTGQSHFIIHITSPKFQGMTRIAQHQQIYKLLAGFMPKPIHALELHTKI